MVAEEQIFFTLNWKVMQNTLYFEFLLYISLFSPSSLQHERLYAIRQQRDKLIKEGKYTPPSHHTGKAEQTPWRNIQLSAVLFLCIANQISLISCSPVQVCK